ncbi:hypothetical protein [Dactylosporangium sp. NPDC005555]|uniref:hypothetical protein n=1 Tax=Dactylosporangium sp. NPDC005555 TaxID=3154889 RepID=UPI0033B5DDE8
MVSVEARGEVIDVLVTEEARSALELPEVRMSFVLRMNQADIVHAKRAMSRIFAGGDFEYDQPLLTGFGCPLLGGRYGGGRSTQNAISGGA